MKEKKTKLNEYIGQHQSLLSNFEGSTSVEGKYEVLKKTINILNTLSIEPVEPRSIVAYDAQLAAQQSEEMYIRQLSKMCEGQEQFQLYKAEKFAQENTKTCIKQNLTKKSFQALHNFKRRGVLFQKKEQEKTENREKQLALPDFCRILLGCSIGYTGLCTEAIISRKVKKVQQSIFNANQNKAGRQKSNFCSLIQKKNLKLKQEIIQLKKKAKNLYELSFDEFKPQSDFDAPQKCKHKIQSRSLHFQKQQEGKIENKKQKKQNSQQLNHQNFSVPQHIFLGKQRLRPYSVSLIKRKKENLTSSNFQYLRI